MLEATLWKSIRENPCKTVASHRTFLQQSNPSFYVQDQFLERILDRWNWNWKRPVRRQIEKYSRTNIERYLGFLYGISSIPFEKLKFLDEAHFVSKDCHRRTALGEKGEPTFVVTSAKLDVSFSLTLLTSLSDPLRQCIINMRTESNTQWDFASFIAFCLESQHLKDGDYLILDNAR